jgi:hypothetical protein
MNDEMKNKRLQPYKRLNESKKKLVGLWRFFASFSDPFTKLGSINFGVLIICKHILFRPINGTNFNCDLCVLLINKAEKRTDS